MRAIDSAGLAKLIEEVKKIAPPTQAPTAGATVSSRPAVTSPRITTTSPPVAMSSDAHRCPPVRAMVPKAAVGCSNITLAATAPITAPATWARP